MRMPCRAIAVSFAFALAACTGVSPRPDAATASELPVRELDAEQSRRLAQLVEECVETVVLRRYEAAERAARAAIVIDPRCARARAVLGMVLLQEAKLVQPPELFLTNRGDVETVLAEQLAPGDPFVGWMRAVFLAETGHMSAAAAAAEAALERSRTARPEERAALLGIAGTYRYELGEERAALPLLEEYASIRTEDAAAAFRIGSCLLRIAAVPKGPRAEADAELQAVYAAKEFARSFELAPGDEDAGLAVGTAWLRAAELAAGRGDQAAAAQHRDAAEQQFDKVARLFLGSAEPLFRVGVTAEQRGDAEAARLAYERALERDGNHLGSLLNLAALCAAGAAPERVPALLQKALQVDAERPALTDAERRSIAKRLRGS